MRGLTLLLAALLSLVQIDIAAAQAPPDSQPAMLDGNTFVIQVLTALELQETIAAKLRHETNLYGKKLVGTGNYWQQRRGNQRVVRWEMQTQLGDQTASFVQVYDGDHLWTDNHLPSRREVHRLDVDWLQTQLRKHYRDVQLDNATYLANTYAGQGGLAQMLADLLRNFSFEPPQPTQLNGLPVRALVGHWRPERLKALWPQATTSADASEWPAQIPHHVLLLVGRNGFPYVCEHRTATDTPLATSLAGLRPTDKPLLRYEIFEVQFAMAIPAETFKFVPGEHPLTNESALVLKQLTAAAAETPQTASLR